MDGHYHRRERSSQTFPIPSARKTPSRELGSTTTSGLPTHGYHCQGTAGDDNLLNSVIVICKEKKFVQQEI